MSAYIKIVTLEYPRYEGDIRLEHPDILESQTGDTFPCPNTYAKVSWVDAPSYSYATQRCGEAQPTFAGGIWRMTWIVRPATQEEMDYREPATKLDWPGAAPNVII